MFLFMEGVCNTDNFSLLSITIDYGPFGFMDEFNPGILMYVDESLNGVNRQPSNGLVKFNRQPSNIQSDINRQNVSRYFKYHYFS